MRLTEYDRRREAFTAAVFTFQFRDLIPHAVYTIGGMLWHTILSGALALSLTSSGVNELTFLSADTALNEVARAEHLTVDNPNQHP